MKNKSARAIGVVCEALECRRLLSGSEFQDAIGLQKTDGSLSDKGSSKSYEIQLAKPGWILATSADVSFDAKMTLEGGNVPQSTLAARPTLSTESAARHLDAGTYTLTLTRVSPRVRKDDTGNYTLYVLVDHSAGDAGNKPTPTLAVNGGSLIDGSSRSFKGFVGDSIGHERTDFYHFTITVPLMISATISPLALGDVNIWQVNGSTKTVVAGANSNSSHVATVSAALLPGDVYVQVDDNSNHDTPDNSKETRYHYGLSVQTSTIESPFSFHAQLNNGGGLTSNGNLELTYDVARPLLQKVTPQVAVYWASGSTESTIIGKPIRVANVDTTFGKQQQMDLKVYDLRNPPANATNLLVVFDTRHQLIVTDRTKLVHSITLGLHDALSYELRFAPAAPTRYEEAALWVRNHKSQILSASTLYNIDPRAIAGPILWEAIQNPTLKSIAAGPGKPHPDSYDVQAVEGPRYPPGKLPVLPSYAVRLAALLDPATAIEYIAAIGNAYAIEGTKAGMVGLRSAPAILDTYYNYAGVTLATVGARFRSYVSQGKNSAAQLTPGPTMGTWVANNLDYISYVLNG